MLYRTLPSRQLHIRAKNNAALIVGRAGITPITHKLGMALDWEKAVAAFAELPTKRQRANVLGNAAMDACRRAHNWQMAVHILDIMMCKKLTDVVSFNIAISACASKPVSFRLLKQMQAEQLKPDIVSYAAAASSCEIHASWRLALHLMRGAGQPNAFLLTSVLGACGRGRQWQRAMWILFDTEKASTVAFNAAINACGQAKRWQLTLRLLHELQTRRMQPSQASFGAAVNACGRQRLWRQILALLALMQESGLQANSWILSGAAWACGRARQWAHAARLPSEQLLDTWQAALDVFAQRVFCNDALGSVCRLGRPSLALKLLLDAKTSRKLPTVPNTISFVVGVEASHRSSSSPAPLVAPVTRSLYSLLGLRRSCWTFPDEAMDYGGNAVLAIDFVHSMRPHPRHSLQFVHGSLSRAVVSSLASLSRGHSVCQGVQVLERQFSLGSATPPALSQLGLVFRSTTKWGSACKQTASGAPLVQPSARLCKGAMNLWRHLAGHAAPGS